MLRLRTLVTCARPRISSLRMPVLRVMPIRGFAKKKDDKKSDAPAAPAATPARSTSSMSTGDDMLTDEQREKSFAARKLTLPPHAARLDGAPDLYSAASSLRKFSKADVGKYYKIDPSKLPETIHKPLADEMKMTGDYLMVRSDPWQLLARLRVGQLNRQSVLIDGGRGVGKTATIALCVYHALEQNSTLVLATHGEEFLRDRYGQVAPNPTRKGILDQPRLTLRFLRTLRETQAEVLKKVQLKKKYTFAVAKSEQSEDASETDAAAAGNSSDSKAAAAQAAPAAPAVEGKTLYDLVSAGAASRIGAAKHWFDIVEEARAATEVNVLIACDGVNWWDHRSELRDPVSSLAVRGRRLALADGFLSLFADPPINGTCLFSTTSHAKDRYVKEYEKAATLKFVVGGYTDTELSAVLRHYATSKMLVSTLDQDYKNRTKALSGNVPADVFDHAMLT